MRSTVDILPLSETLRRERVFLFLTVHRCLTDMKESGEIEYNGRRSISTAQIDMESPSKYMKVLGYVACGEGQEEEENRHRIYPYA